MKKIFILSFIAFFSLSCSNSASVQVVVSNESDMERVDQIVELDGAALRSKLNGAQEFVVMCAESGEPIASQLTYDDKLIFQCSIGADADARYIVEAGVAGDYAPLVFGKQYPERVDDFAWESDRIAFRTYGPALQASGERAFGYDVWVKSTSELVVNERYRKEHEEGISYHQDHGDGLDCYKVGPTLGSGTTALMVGGEIVYPYCYKSYEVLDNGPLRLTFAMDYNPLKIGDDENVIEHRVISIDAGSHLNKTTVTYSNLSQPTTLVAGLVMQDAEGKSDYSAELENGYVSYATDCGKNGIIYIGVVTPQTPFATQAIYFDEDERKSLRGGATGHVVAMSQYEPNSTYLYYWGSGWSKFGFDSHDQWQEYLKGYAAQLESPLKVTMK